MSTFENPLEMKVLGALDARFWSFAKNACERDGYRRKRSSVDPIRGQKTHTEGDDGRGEHRQNAGQQSGLPSPVAACDGLQGVSENGKIAGFWVF